MNMSDCMAFYVQAAKIDTRLPPKRIDEFDAWETELKGIPALFAPQIFHEIYSEVQILPLQTGHIVKAWKVVKEKMNAAIARCQSFDKRARDLDTSECEDAEAYNALVEAHNTALESLPVEVAVANGFSRKEPVHAPNARKPTPAPDWFKSLQKG